MNEIIVLVIIVVLLVGSQVYIIKMRQKPKKSTYRIVKAGDVSQVTKLYETINSLNDRAFTYNGKPVSINDYMVFIVEGESMSSSNIHTGDVVFVKELMGDSRLTITSGKILLLEIQNPKNQQGDAEYKLRKFIDYISMNNITDENISNWINEHQIQYTTRFINKFKKSKEELSTLIDDNDLFLCSMTWHNGDLDYSFHPIKVLVGVVEFSLPKDKI